MMSSSPPPVGRITAGRIPDLAEFDGVGVAYWASPVEARLCEGQDAAHVGGGNSAGQAVKKIYIPMTTEGVCLNRSQLCNY
jgi:hypothetical protein